jgi:[protein-PII] uridylyltransferase
VDALLERRRAGGHAAAPGEAKPKVAVDNRLSDEYTVIEVKCPDRLGLLYLITRTLSSLDLDIASARIATEIDQALDTFYVLDHKGRRLEDPDAIEHARGALEQALLQPL